MDLVAGGASDVGMVRNANQDSWAIRERLWAVADGMGGHQGGEVASELAIDVLTERFDEFTAQALSAAARAANAAVHKEASEHAELRGMGTTLCAMGLVETDDGAQALDVINIGDSRCYRWRDGEMTQITRDHSLVEDMRAAGQLTDAEAAVHPHRNIVTRALGIQSDVKVDSFRVIPATGDRYVLCSDGLFNEVPVDRIAATLRRLADPQEAASELVRQANEAGGRDNVTCVVVDVADVTGVSAAAGAGDIIADPAPREAAPDVAGFTTALSGAEADEEGAPRDETTAAGNSDQTQAPAAPRARLRRVTWRTLAFALVFLVILAAAVAAIGWYSRGTYYVGVAAGEVTVFKGRPGGVLWFEPTVEKRTGIAKNQIPVVMRDTIVAGKLQPSAADADTYVDAIRERICEEIRNGAKPPTSTPGSPTTTIPGACRDLVPGRPNGTEPTTVPPTTTNS